MRPACMKHSVFFDDHPVDVIFAEGVREEGIGRALMNRLYKAASSVGEGI